MTAYKSRIPADAVYLTAVGQAFYNFSYLEWVAIWTIVKLSPNGFASVPEGEHSIKIADALSAAIADTSPELDGPLREKLKNFTNHYREAIQSRDALLSSHPYTAGLEASLPSVDHGAAELYSIPGNVPDPARRPPGCAFHPRCGVSDGRALCRENIPALRETGAAGRLAACHFAEETPSWARARRAELTRRSGSKPVTPPPSPDTDAPPAPVLRVDSLVKEFTVRLAADVPAVLAGLRDAGFLAGLPLGPWFPDLPDALAVAVTEKRTRAEIDALAAALRDQLAKHA